ncbi:uncharacterized protein EV422DRAFT_58430 [Fimicolochytrium jonesii]|uniref:uncharacterized protein n=1 Tax=Fimicolochytrium jonesii TaxID=1396493 RepID=UPI0022FDBABD|nr:uncharacterized protein EV422DRAFT_58430 [Fimicolochytrium jonesii]KAI8820658.1 hypothetical protein EV422DRAFT_58430 [Fimicolochytrium jonesii]
MYQNDINTCLSANIRSHGLPTPQFLSPTLTGPKSHAINALRRRTADPTQHADKGKPRPASALGVSSPAAAGKTEEEYVKNLQQQLFLLEMETRYLRARSDDTGLYQQTGELPEGRGDTGAGADKRRVPLGEVIKDLKQKYADLQDEYKEEVQTLKTNLFSVQSQYRTSQEKLSEATKQHTTLTDQFTTFQKESNTEKQGLLRELSRLKQQVANADGEAKRWEGMYERAIQEVEAIRADKRRLESVVDSSKRRIEEVEAAGTHYEKRIEELCHEIASVKHSPPPEPSEALTTHIASLQQTLNAVQSTLSTMQSTSTTQSKHISDLTTQLKVAESINKRLLTDGAEFYLVPSGFWQPAM